MKKTLLMVLVIAVLLARPTTSGAINREWSAALGFLGGMLVANQWNCAPPPPPCAPAPVYYYPTPPPPPPVVYREVVVAPPPPPAGHYEWREERTWVPGCWMREESGPCGYYRRIWQPGYYRTDRIQVWVDEGCGYEGGHHGHHDWRD